MPPVMRTRFRSLDEYRAERNRCKDRLDNCNWAMAMHMEAIRNKEFRHELAWSAGQELIQAWRPLRMVESLVRSEQGMIGSMVAALIGSRGRTFKGKILAWAAAAVVPFLIKRFANAENLASVLHGARDAWDRFTDNDDSEDDLDDDGSVEDED